MRIARPTFGQLTLMQLLEAVLILLPMAFAVWWTQKIWRRGYNPFLKSDAYRFGQDHVKQILQDRAVKRFFDNHPEA